MSLPEAPHDEGCPSDEAPAPATGPSAKGRRDAIQKLAYVSPVIASLLFSQRSVAQLSPIDLPPPPPG